MILHRFGKTSLHKSRYGFGMRLDQFCDVRVFRSLDDTDTFLGVFMFHFDFVGVLKEFSEQRIAHSNGVRFLDTVLHPLDVFLDHVGNFRVVGFR